MGPTEFYTKSRKLEYLTSFGCESITFFLQSYHKILKICPGAYIFQRPFLGAYFWRGLSTEGNLCFKIDWASLIVGNKFTVFYFFLLCI